MTTLALPHPTLTLTLPMPPTTNNLYINVPRVGRIKSPKYRAWFDAAGHAPLQGGWERLYDKGDQTPDWKLHLLVWGLTKASDLSNRIKAAEDLLCAMTGLEDKKVVEIYIQKRPKHALLGACITVQVEVLG